MPFLRPSLTQLRNQAVQDITTSGVPGLTGLLRNAVLRVLAWCMAGLAYGVYGYADWIARMGVPFTATDEFLHAWAALVGIVPKDATAATGTAQFTGLPDRLLPSGAALTRQDGVPYETTADGQVDLAGFVTVPILALEVGAHTNAEPETAISIASPIAGINSGGIILGPAAGGADQETDDELRSRMLARYRAPPHGGAAHDYIAWALEVPGVTRAWVTPLGLGAGTVLVHPMFDDARAAHDGFPQGTDGVAGDERRGPPATGDQRTVADHIWPVQPVTAFVWVVGPQPYPIDVTLYELDPNTADVRALIRDALVDLLLVIGEVAGTVYPSQINQAILATGEVRHFTLAAPQAALTAPAGALPVLGDLTIPIPREAGPA
jgi:uncharacterized phage protein gp47/JayE